MNRARKPAVVLLVLAVFGIACATSTPTAAPAAVAPTGSSGTQPPTLALTTAASEAPSSTPTASPSPTLTRTPAPSPTPTTPPLQLEILASQVWTDYQGNARANVLLRNPYDFPVAPYGYIYANAMSAAGERLDSGSLYFLDGISGGWGFFLPGETIAANVCFTCEEAILADTEITAEFVLRIEDATGRWNVSTEVEAAITSVDFDGDSPIFWVSGTATNNSAAFLDSISVRTFVFGEDGSLIGASEVSAWDIPAGATVAVSGYGIGQTPAGSFTYEVTALGVDY